MSRIRVLVVDDAVAVRRLVCDALGADSAIEVVGTAENGRVALARVPQLKPDVIVLDLEMPVMSGLETLVELRRAHPKIAVIIFSADSRPGAEATLEALWLGANDYVTKSSAHSPSQAVRHIHAELVPRIKALCMHLLERPAEKRPARPRDGRGRAVLPGPRARLVAIGASTGGPNALARLLPSLPADFSAPIVVVQHMPPMFTRFLAERLSARSEIEIAEAVDGDVLHPGKAWIAPGDHHMTLGRAGTDICIRLDQGPPVHSCRPSVDRLFRSVAAVAGGAALGVIRTGMGQDGRAGCESVVEAGGRVIAQDAATSVVWGMPGMVARAGLAERVLPLDEIADEILRRVGRGHARRSEAA